MTNLITAIKNVLHPNINVALCKIWEITCCKKEQQDFTHIGVIAPSSGQYEKLGKRTWPREYMSDSNVRQMLFWGFNVNKTK